MAKKRSGPASVRPQSLGKRRVRGAKLCSMSFAVLLPHVVDAHWHTVVPDLACRCLSLQSDCAHHSPSCACIGVSAPCGDCRRSSAPFGLDSGSCICCISICTVGQFGTCVCRVLGKWIGYMLGLMDLTMVRALSFCVTHLAPHDFILRSQHSESTLYYSGVAW